MALKSVGAAILGDELYGGVAADRVYLHAYALNFSLFGHQYRFQVLPDSGVAFAELLQRGLPQSWLTPADFPWPAAPAQLAACSDQDE